MEASAPIQDILGPTSIKDELQRIESKDRPCHLHFQFQSLQHQESSLEVLYDARRSSQPAGFGRYLEHDYCRRFELLEVVHHPQHRGLHSCDSWQFRRW